MTVIRLSEIAQVEPVPGYKARIVHARNMTIVHWDIVAGAVMPEHSHPHEQVVNLVEGRFEIDVRGRRDILEPGSVVVIPSNESHSGKAITNSRIIDAFYPIRDDFR